MKKLLIATCLFCITGLFAACDKDDDSGNPFARTTWKSRTMHIEYQEFYHFTYEVYRFESATRFLHWFEDESGNRISATGSGTYVVMHVPCELILTEGSSERVFDYPRNSSPTSFWFKPEDSDELIYFYRQ